MFAGADAVISFALLVVSYINYSKVEKIRKENELLHIQLKDRLKIIEKIIELLKKDTKNEGAKK